MRSRVIFLSLFFIPMIAQAQSMPVQMDTSFSTFSAYKKALKTNPGITIVEEISSNDILEQKNIVYCDAGRKLLLDVFYPSTKEKVNGTAIMIIHGGGWRSGNRSQHYPLAQRLAASGYTCFTIEYRLSTEAKYPAAVIDIKSAVRWIKMNAPVYNIDTTKITALGFSAGGELAAFAATTGNMQKFESGCNTQASSVINALIDIDGTLSFVHPESSEGDDSKKISAATQWFGIAKKDSIELWQEASPLDYVSSYTAPSLFINSAVAPMHAGRSDFIRVLDANHIYSEVHTFNDAPHTFCLFHPWFDPTINYIDSFLKKIFK